MNTQITYNGNTTEIETNRIATIKCNGKKMSDDIVISFPIVGIIIYNEARTNVEANKTATLVCNGKTMKSDVVISTGTYAIGSATIEVNEKGLTVVLGDYTTTANDSGTTIIIK